jgi:hypothetical protein
MRDRDNFPLAVDAEDKYVALPGRVAGRKVIGQVTPVG